MSATFEVALVLKVVDEAAGVLAATVKGLEKVSSQARKTMETAGSAAAAPAVAGEAVAKAMDKASSSTGKALDNYQALRSVTVAAGSTAAAAWSRSSNGAVTLAGSAGKAGAAIAKMSGQLLPFGASATASTSRASGAVITLGERAGMTQTALKEMFRQATEAAQKAREASQKYAKTLTELRQKGGELADGARNAGMWTAGVGAGALYGAMKPVQAFTEQESIMTAAKLPFMRKAGTDPVWAQIQPIIERLGQELPGTNADFAEIAGHMAALGLGARDIRDGGLEAAAALKVIGRLSNEEAGGLASQMARALKVPGNQFRAFADEIQKVSFAAGISIRELGSAIPYMAPQLQLFGIQGLAGAKALGTTMAVLKNAGLSGTELGSAMGSFLDRLPVLQERLLYGRGWKAKEGANLMQKYSLGNLGRQVFDEKGELRGADPMAKMANLVVVFDRINRAITSTKDKALLFDELLGDVGKRAGVALTIGNWNEARGKLLDQADIQTRMSEVLKTQAAMWESLTGTVWIFLASVADPLAPVIKGVTQAINWLTGKLIDWNRAHPMLTASIASTVVVASALLVVGGGLLLVVGLMGKAVLASVAGYETLTAVLGLSKVAMAGVGAEALATTAKLGILARASGAIAAVGSGLTAFMAAPLATMGGLLTSALAFPVTILSGITGVAAAPILAIIAAIAVAALLIYKYWEPIKAFFKGIWSGIQMDAGPILYLWNAFSDALGGIWRAAASLVDVFIPMKSGQEGVNEAFAAGEIVGLALAKAVEAIQVAFIAVAKGVETVAILVATLADGLMAIGKSLWWLQGGRTDKAGAVWSGVSDRFWGRLEGSSMNPGREVARAGAIAGSGPSAPEETSGGGLKVPTVKELIKTQGGQGGQVVLHYSPKVELHGQAGPEDEARIWAILQKHKHEVMEMFRTEMERKGRWNGDHS